MNHIGSSSSSSRRVLLIDLLAILFGLGTWICVNGLWVELPLFVQVLPEGWNLPSYLAIVIQIANIAPLTYSILNSFFPAVVTEKRTIYFTILIGSAATLLVALFWESTSVVGGEKHSTGLLSSVLFMAMVDCSSRVLYLPFMSKFQERYLTSFFIGEGLSAFVPSIFALIQGVGGNPECVLTNNSTTTDPTAAPPSYVAYTKPPRFSIEVFFFILLANVLLSAVAFHLLNYNGNRLVKSALAAGGGGPESNNEGLPPGSGSPYIHTPLNKARPLGAPQITFYSSISPTGSMERLPAGELEVRVRNNNSIKAAAAGGGGGGGADFVQFEQQQVVEGGEFEESTTKLPKSVFIHVLLIQVFACMLSNGVFPAIQSYSCLPYGNLPYHLVATLSTMANPAVCFLLFVLPKPTEKSISCVFGLALLVSSYVLTTALKSPEPPLVGQIVGEGLLVLSWILLVSFFTYVKVSVATILRSDGKHGLFWCGAITQLGSAIGATVTFFIVNYTSVFEAYYACQSGNGGESSYTSSSTAAAALLL